MDKAELSVLLSGALGGEPQADDPYSAWPGLQMLPPARQFRVPPSQFDSFGPVRPWPAPITADKWSIFEPFTPEGP